MSCLSLFIAGSGYSLMKLYTTLAHYTLHSVAPGSFIIICIMYIYIYIHKLITRHFTDVCTIRVSYISSSWRSDTLGRSQPDFNYFFYSSSFTSHFYLFIYLATFFIFLSAHSLTLSLFLSYFLQYGYCILFFKFARKPRPKNLEYINNFQELSPGSRRN